MPAELITTFEVLQREMPLPSLLQEQQPSQHSVLLPNGRLHVSVARSAWGLQRLCGFAARNNPRRGFLFVSKVLGKHWPSSPQEMRATYIDLALAVPAPRGRPVLFIGMAETATGLGQGVFEAYLRRHGPGSAIYVQTTRYPISGTQTVDFEESHSHAQQLRLHLPQHPTLRRAFLHAQQLVLVDDELSTGSTFLALISAFRRVNPHLEHASIVSLTDFMGADAHDYFRHNASIASVDFVSLLEGSFEFEPDPDFRAAKPAPAQAAVGCRSDFMGPSSARLGTDQALSLPEALIDGLNARLPTGRPILVLGSGEFMHPAWCLGNALAGRGADIRVQSTTRSPILIGADINSRIELQDPYGEGIPNYLYNVDPVRYGAVLLCCETPPSPGLVEAAERLSAEIVSLRRTTQTVA
jgi:hypothetical protein